MVLQNTQYIVRCFDLLYHPLKLQNHEFLSPDCPDFFVRNKMYFYLQRR